MNRRTARAELLDVLPRLRDLRGEAETLLQRLGDIEPELDEDFHTKINNERTTALRQLEVFVERQSERWEGEADQPR